MNSNICRTNTFLKKAYLVILLGFLVGAAIGGVTAILLAPDKGKNTRASIADSTGDLLSRFKTSYNNAIDNVTSLLDSVAEDGDQNIEPTIVALLEENSVDSDHRNQY